MDDGSRTSLLITVVLLGLAAFFALTETAISSVSSTKIKVMAEHGDRRAVNVTRILDSFERAITTLLICTNIVHISLASVVTIYVTRKWGLNAVSLSTILTTVIVFFVGEMIPKSIGKKNCESCSLGTAGILLVLMKIMYPLSTLLSSFAKSISSITKSEPEITVTEDELYDIIEDLEEEGAIDEEQSDLFSSALKYTDKVADSIITPRVHMVAIDIDDNINDILSLIINSNHSRIPVYKGTPDNIIGILPIRTVLKEYITTGRIDNINQYLFKPFYASKNVPIHELIEDMSHNQTTIAVIKDDFGGTEGIVTIEDILEELVGDIWDESDILPEGMTGNGGEQQ